MTTADPIKLAREALDRTEKAADVISKMFMAAARLRSINNERRLARELEKFDKDRK